VRQFGRPQDDVACFALNLCRLPIIQSWKEEIEIGTPSVPFDPGVKVLIDLRQALETAPIAADIGQ